MQKTESTGSCLAALAVAPVVIVIGALLQGTVLSVIWGWFIVPVFHAPSLSIAYAIGLGLVVSYLTTHVSSGSKDEQSTLEIVFSGLVGMVVNAGITLAFAFILHLFV